jgi:hypothetical protein
VKAYGYRFLWRAASILGLVFDYVKPRSLCLT